MLGGGCMKQKHLHSTIGPAHAPNQHTQYVTLPFSYIELIVSFLYMLSREPGCARLYHTASKRLPDVPQPQLTIFSSCVKLDY